MNTFIALKVKKQFSFHCVAKTEAKFSEKVARAYALWRGMQSRSVAPETKTEEAFLSNYDKVKITIESIL